MVLFSTTGLLLHVALFRLGTTHDCAIGQAGPSIWSRLRAVRRPPRATIQRFQQCLLDWYAKHGRDLPWRRTRHPYRVLVSEIMLQQTQVDRVVPKYREFLRHYPTIERLAAAPVDAVRRLWYPLGYNIRPVRLHAIACETV